MTSTKIEWADRTWNPVTGCSPVSEGCQNCYASRMANRLHGRYGYPADHPFRITYHPDRVYAPVGWRKSSRIFVCSMGDLFHDEVRDNWLDDIMSVVSRCHTHTFMFLTKRPENMKKRLAEYWPFRNLWLGVTAENQRTADERIPALLGIPAAVRFVSVEPMLGPVGLARHFPHVHGKRNDLFWVICGAETGPGARPMDIAWARSLRDQCREAGVPFFFKKDTGGDVPWGLMVREFPKVTVEDR